MALGNLLGQPLVPLPGLWPIEFPAFVSLMLEVLHDAESDTHDDSQPADDCSHVCNVFDIAHQILHRYLARDYLPLKMGLDPIF